MSQPVVLVTGASSGIGESTAIKLAAQGAIAYGAARHVDKMQKLADLGIHVLHLDVTDDDSARSTIDHMKFPRLSTLSFMLILTCFLILNNKAD